MTRSILCKAFGPVADIALREVELPDPGAGQVRLRMLAAGVNFPDILTIEGKYQGKPQLPFTPGAELCGIVEAVGPGVVGLSPGMRVMGVVGTGAFAEAANVTAARLIPCPEGMDHATAAAFPMCFGTSMHALAQRGQLKPGETLLVLGAGGGVGLAAVQLGLAMGATVIAAAGSQTKLDAARAGGAHHLINYTTTALRDRVTELTGGAGVDVVYDPVGGDLLEQSVRACRRGARVLIVGFASGGIPRIPANLLLLKEVALIGVFFGAFRDKNPEENRANFARMFDWYAQGRLSSLAYRTMDLSRAAEAMELLARREVVGKIVLTVRPASANEALPAARNAGGYGA